MAIGRNHPLPDGRQSNDYAIHKTMNGITEFFAGTAKKAQNSRKPRPKAVDHEPRQAGSALAGGEMKSLSLLVAILLLFFALSRSVALEVPQAQGAAGKASPMPAERAKATFEDARVKLFMSAVAKDFGGKCSSPDYTKTPALLVEQGPGGDFSSSFYDLTISCPGNNGLAAVKIKVEFSPPLGTPLDLLLSLQYTR